MAERWVGRATTGRQRDYVVIFGSCLALTAVAQLIGERTFDLGIGKVTLLPIVWGLILGGALSLQPACRVPVRVQRLAAGFMELGVVVLIAKVGFLAGKNYKELIHAGPAMLTQELGHLIGTLVLSLPLAVLIGMGRPAIGACFSIDRETSFAMVTERYGRTSPEYNGVLAMYVFGTIFGALWMSLLGSFLADHRVLDPKALAMGAGVGSNSMMLAAATSIADQHPDIKDQILTLGAVSSLATAAFGLYVSRYVALPLADRLYVVLDRTALGRAASRLNRGSRDGSATSSTGSLTGPTAADVSIDSAAASRPANQWAVSAVLFVAIGLALAMTPDTTRSMVGKGLVGLLILLAVVLVARYLHRITHASWMILVATIGGLLASPISPWASTLNGYVDPVGLATIGVPTLVIAGLGLGKDWPLLRRVGWRVVPVGLVSIASSFLFAAVVAHFALGIG